MTANFIFIISLTLVLSQFILSRLEFDEDHIARIVANVPKNGPITVLAAAPKAENQRHQH
jgi:hypothetical protein